MAPKRRHGKVVGSVVKTKVVQETVEVTATAIVADDPTDQAPAALAAPSVDVSGSKSVRVVEVTTPTTGGGSAAAKKQPKRGRSDHEDDADATPVALQSQETKDPNEQQQEEAEDGGGSSKKKKKTTKQQAETPTRPSLEAKPAASREEEKGTVGKKKQRRRRRSFGNQQVGMGYKRYVWRVLKQVHPDLGMSGRAMEVLDMMMADMFERLAEEAARLCKVSGRATLSSREVQSDVRLVLPRELGKHAISEGVKAISKYMAA